MERVTRIVRPLTDPSVSGETRCAVVDRVRTVGAMRVAVDADKCQGHNRCYAIAPELFDVDEYGQAVVIGDGTVAPELADKASLAVANCPEYAISISEEEQRDVDLRTGDRLGDRSRSHRPGLQPQRPGDLADDPRQRLPGRPHRSVSRDVGSAHPRVRLRGRLRHRALHEPRRRRQPGGDGRLPGGTDRRSPADHQRSAISPSRPAHPPPAVLAEGDRTLGTRDPRPVR